MICGCFCVGIILFFLIGPFVMFSNLSFIASYNLVTDANVKLGVKIQDREQKETYQFPMYLASSALNIETITEEQFDRWGFDVAPETKFFKFD